MAFGIHDGIRNGVDARARCPSTAFDTSLNMHVLSLVCAASQAILSLMMSACTLVYNLALTVKPGWFYRTHGTWPWWCRHLSMGPLCMFAIVTLKFSLRATAL